MNTSRPRRLSGFQGERGEQPQIDGVKLAGLAEDFFGLGGMREHLEDQVDLLQRLQVFLRCGHAFEAEALGGLLVCDPGTRLGEGEKGDFL